ncbi:MAG TPA: endonuclease/exonuclease/phosphatase family protein [Chitinophagaceae bacterium]|nr:endonuclease/exonuclease/phosphatase family protein [Chitinophagaceae bacterium]
MASKLRIFTKRVLIFINYGVVFFFLLACLIPYLDPQTWWFISFLGIGFPFLLLAVAGFMVWWLFVKRRYALISGIALLLGFKSVTALFAISIPGFTGKKKPETIRIATWNVARFIEMKRNNNKGSQIRLKMLDQIRRQNADILCLQEFFHSYDSTLYDNLDYLRDSLHYPYYCYSYELDGDKQFTGSAIFSRFPIIDSGMIRYPRPTLPEALIHADIRLKNRIIRVYTTHLQSVQLLRTDYEKIDKIKEGEDGIVSNSKTIFSKIKRGVVKRKIQTDIIKQVLGDSPYPVIFCGDLNDIPNSYTYFKIRGDMQDAFLKKGFGIGRTFSAISPTLRIDYIFADSRFRIDQFKRIVKNSSDHYMLVTDIELKNINR